MIQRSYISRSPCRFNSIELLVCALRLVSVLMVVGSARGQGPTPSFQQFNVEDGLSQGSITAIVQDYQGYMWIGTHDGLNRFDGIEFRTYRHNPSDPHSLSDNVISFLFEDHDKILWVGTVHGLNRFDRADEQFIHEPVLRNDTLSQTDYAVSAIWESHHGGDSKLWAGITGDLIYREGEIFRRANMVRKNRDALINASVQVIREDREGFLWLGSGYGFFRFDPRTRTVDNFHDCGSDVQAILEPSDEKDKKLWIGTREKGLMQYDRQTGRITQYNESSVTSLLEDHAGRFWVGSGAGLGLLRHMHGGDVTVDLFQHEPGIANSLSDNFITKLYEDASGALWVGTYNGLNRLDEFSPNFTVYQHHPGDPNSLGHDFVLPIIEDRTGEIWFGTFGAGLFVLPQGGKREEHFTQLRHDPTKAQGLCSDNVRSMLKDRTGIIWIGTSAGLTMYNPANKVFTCYPMIPPENLAAFWTESLGEARDGTVWAGGTATGLVKIERTETDGRHALKFTRYLLQGVLGPGESDQVNAIVEDRSGMIWVGTEFGLVRFDPHKGTYARYVHDPGNHRDSTGISDNGVWSICIDTSTSTDVLWIGTSHGLNSFNPTTEKFRSYFEQDGFPSAYVYGILRDEAGRLWLSTNHGLTRFDDRRPGGKKFKNYDVSDGIPGNEFNRKAFCRLRNGEFLFGGTKGVIRFDPMQMRDNPYVPPVVLTAFSKFGAKVRFDRDIGEVSSMELKYAEDVFSFEFASLNYTHAAKNQYAYMMAGFDKDWWSKSIITAGQRQLFLPLGVLT